MKELVTIVIPVLDKPYQTTELNTLKHYQDHLGDFPITFLKGESATIPDELTAVFPMADNITFDSRYLHNQQTFTRLLLNPDFYEQFSWTRFLLIADPRITIQKNELAYWCRQGYDLLQPPPSFPSAIPLADQLRRRFDPVAFVQKYQKTHRLTEAVGSFSLRKVDTFAKLTKSQKRNIHTFVSSFPAINSDQLFWEFFVNRLSPQIIVPNAISRVRFIQSADDANEAHQAEKPFALLN